MLRLLEREYGGSAEDRFGPTLAAEHLVSEHGLVVDAETLRRWTREEELWTSRRRRKRHRRRRRSVFASPAPRFGFANTDPQGSNQMPELLPASIAEHP